MSTAPLRSGNCSASPTTRCARERSRTYARWTMLKSMAAAVVGDIVEITLRIGIVEIDCWRKDVIPEGHQCGSDAGRAARSLRMADHRLRRGAGDLPGVRAEGEFHGARLDAIVEIGRRA